MFIHKSCITSCAVARYSTSPIIEIPPGSTLSHPLFSFLKRRDPFWRMKFYIFHSCDSCMHVFLSSSNKGPDIGHPSLHLPLEFELAVLSTLYTLLGHRKFSCISPAARTLCSSTSLVFITTSLTCPLVRKSAWLHTRSCLLTSLTSPILTIESYGDPLTG